MDNIEQYKNQDLVLRVDHNVDLDVFNINKYEPFFDILCRGREYQKEAIREVLLFLLGGNYKNLKQLAEENYHQNEVLQDKYPRDKDFFKLLQIPDKLSCSVDLATGTGKSYVMYGIAQIMLAEGVVDRVLVLCPSLTIEDGLTEKFEELASSKVLKDSLPNKIQHRNPRIINANQTIEKGDICIENIHSVYKKTNSAIEDSLKSNGKRTLILSDEGHHVYSPEGKDFKLWKKFLVDDIFGFKYMVGFSGTCYTDNEYFTDVVYRYSLKQAIEQKFIKDVEYVVENQSDILKEDTKFQEIYQVHKSNKRLYNKIKPLTIFVTKNKKECEIAMAHWQKYLMEEEKLSREQSEEKTLIVTSDKKHEANRPILKKVDNKTNKVEYIFSVSMLTEGWDVKNVFQIVPHEKRAFNSKLLISQVLGRGLRLPLEYEREQPAVKVFNHDSWYKEIKGLVDEVLEREKRIYSYVVNKTKNYNFELLNIEYDKEPTIEEYKKEGSYTFKNSFVYQPQNREKEGEVVYKSVKDPTSEKTIKVHIKGRFYTVEEVVNEVRNKLSLWSEDETNYLKMYPEEKVEKIILDSLVKINEKKKLVSEENMQKTLQGFGVIRRSKSKRKTLRFVANDKDIYTIKTQNIEKTSISISALYKDGSIFYDDITMGLSDENEIKRIKEVEKEYEDGSSKLNTASLSKIENSYLLKSPLNAVLVSHRPEREFTKQLVKQENAEVIDAWIKSRDTGFYDLEYSWRKGEHPKNGKFNPDYFLKIGKNILVVEIKSNTDITPENKGKVKYAREHFKRLNGLQTDQKYYFWMIAPRDYQSFFQAIREGKYDKFISTFENGLFG